MSGGCKTTWSFQYPSIALDWAEMPVSFLLLISPGSVKKQGFCSAFTCHGKKPWHFQWLWGLKLLVLPNLPLSFPQISQTVWAERHLGAHQSPPVQWEGLGRGGTSPRFTGQVSDKSRTRTCISTPESVLLPGHQVAAHLKRTSTFPTSTSRKPKLCARWFWKGPFFREIHSQLQYDSSLIST
jgi:hypothetical protein